MEDALTNLYRTYLDAMDTGDDVTPGKHAYEWENYIKPNSESTDDYHQMATYNMLDKKLPENDYLRKIMAVGSPVGVGLASLLYDPFQGYLDHGIDAKRGNTKGSLLSYIADQNPFPQAWNRMKGATQFAADQFNLPMGNENSGRNNFREAYNKTVVQPRNLDRTASRVSPQGQTRAYGLYRGGASSL